jgi:hypothetical protein
MPRTLALALTLLPAMALADRPAAPARPRPPTPAPASGCLGRWQGWGRNGSTPPWSIDMVVTSERGARCGTIEYPSLGCGGYLTNCQRRGDVVTWTEVYTHNPGTCAPAGRVDGRCEGDAMQWEWTGWEVVRSRLQRAR